MHDKMMKVLKSEDIDVSPKFKFWVRHTFYLIKIGSIELIYNKKSDLPLITQENIYEKIDDCHKSVGHSGRDKTWNEVNILIMTFSSNRFPLK